MKSLMLLWKKLAEESANRCGTSATRDIKYVSGRFEHEGLSFLTITLPSFGKDIEKCLDQGSVNRDSFQGFSWRAGLPRFLGGFLDCVFDRGSGELLDEPSVDAILALRQLTLMFGKILVPCSETRVKKAINQYVECEQEVRDSDARITDQQWSDFIRVGELLFGSVFAKVEDFVFDRTLLPKHGPGATADKIRGNGKYRHRTWPSRLESYFPLEEYVIPNSRFRGDLSQVDFLEPGKEIPVKVTPVPKTLKTPRIIAIEPVAMQYCQQALLGGLLSSIYEDDYLKKMLGFNDQTPNQRMAKKGSSIGTLATLDLSEASDRVSNQHVRAMLSNYPILHGAVDSCRSRKADVPGKGVIRLAKYASMGSALCFPFEAMVFLIMIFLGIERELNSPLSDEIVQRFHRRVRVYGDDIIVPVHFVRPVIESLESFGIKVNRDKSFWTGKFRESCGREYYDGHDISIVRVRRVFPSSREHVAEVISTVSLRNQLYLAGYWQTVRWLDKEIENVISHFPVVLPSSPVLGRFSFLGYETQEISGDTHTPLVKGYVVSARSPSDPLDGSEALTKCLLMMERRGTSRFAEILSGTEVPITLKSVSSLPTVDTEHLERAGRPQSVRIKLRGASAV